MQSLALAEPHTRLALFLIELDLVLLDLVGHGEEGALDVYGLFRRSLQKGNFILFRQLLALLEAHLPLALQVALVPHQDFAHARSRELVDLAHPRFHVLERVLVRHVVHYYYSVRASVVRTCQSPEPFLTSGVPLLTS